MWSIIIILRAKKEYAVYAKRRQSSDGDNPSSPSYDPLMELTASVMELEPMFAERQYDSSCRDLTPAEDGPTIEEIEVEWIKEEPNEGSAPSPERSPQRPPQGHSQGHLHVPFVDYTSVASTRQGSAEPRQPILEPLQPTARPLTHVARPLQPAAEPLQPPARPPQPASESQQPVPEPWHSVPDPQLPVGEPGGLNPRLRKRGKKRKAENQREECYESLMESNSRVQEHYLQYMHDKHIQETDYMKEKHSLEMASHLAFQNMCQTVSTNIASSSTTFQTLCATVNKFLENLMENKKNSQK